MSASPRSERILELYASGLSTHATGRLVGVSSGTVYNTVKRHAPHLLRPQGNLWKFTDEEMQKIKRQYLYGRRSLSQLGEQYNASAGTVARNLERIGVKRRPAVTPKGIKTKKIPPEHLRETIRLYRDEFLTIKEVARIQNLSAGAVHQRLKKAGIPRRTLADYNNFNKRSNSPPHREVEEAITLYQAGWSCKEIADKQFLHEHTVRRRLRAVGIPMRNRSEAGRLRHQRHPKNKQTHSRGELGGKRISLTT